MKRNQRYESRLEKRKQNRFLNIAIGLVFLLIVVVAFNLFSGDEKDTASTSENGQTASKNESKDNASIEMESEKEEQNNEAGTSEESDSDSEESKEEEAQAEQPEGGGPEGPWEPIGTTQSEPHQKSYDDQSQDWKEMVQALSYATNIPEDEMTIFWLGNGGGPDLSKGTVQSKADKVKYDVVLQWIPEKGWQPTSVTPVQ